MAPPSSPTANVATLPQTIFAPETCLTRGYCEVSKTRTPKSHKLYYEIHGPRHAKTGDQRPLARLVFIMGLNNSCFGWHNQLLHFGPKAGFQSLVVDNRGVGLSDVPSGVYKTSEMARDLQELLEDVGWTEPRSLHVVGVSMGGMIAQELATLIPDRIASLVLTSTTAGNTRDVAPLPALKMFSKLMFIRNPEAMVRIVIDGLYPVAWLEAPDSRTGQCTNRDRITKEFLHRHAITRQQTLAGRLYQTYAALGHYLSPERLLQISQDIPKVAILTGDLDEIIDPQRSRDLERFLPGSEYVLFEGGGHAIVSQFADRYNATLERIVAEAQSRVSSSAPS